MLLFSQIISLIFVTIIYVAQGLAIMFKKHTSTLLSQPILRIFETG